MKYNEELAITDSIDDLILLDRKFKRSDYRVPDIDAAMIEVEKKAPLKLRLWVRQSSNDNYPRNESKNKEV